MKRTRTGSAITMILSLLLLASTASAAGGIVRNELGNNVLNMKITPYYLYTDSISASLSFSGGNASCGGVISPSGTESVSITVTLYKKNGSSWNYVDSWSGSSTDGRSATASGSSAVSSGTYKVFVSGDVGGKEFPTKSVTKTKK